MDPSGLPASPSGSSGIGRSVSEGDEHPYPKTRRTDSDEATAAVRKTIEQVTDFH
jgi:hypothetical protein